VGDLAPGALGGGVEGPEVLDLVPPELQAQGLLAPGREEVQDPAPGGQLAGAGDGLDPPVADLDEVGQELVPVQLGPLVQLAPDFQATYGGREVLGRKE